MRRKATMGTWLLLILLPGVNAASPAGSPPSREEVLSLVYPGSEFKSESIFLSGSQKSLASELAGEQIPTALFARYIARRNGEEVGRAYVDTHVVRTKKESLLICLDSDGRVKRIEATAFLEPPEYQASQLWLEQFYGKALADDLAINRSIRPLAGATLTASAVTQAVRRILAVDRVLRDGSLLR